MATAATPSKSGWLELLDRIQTEHGALVLVLVLLLAFFCFLLWRLIWKVWSAAMEAKDQEIARLAKERDKYQALVFERLRSSQLAAPKDSASLEDQRKGTD